MLSLKILKETNRTKRKLSVLGFDELNVLKETDELYEIFEQDCEIALRDVLRLRYEEVLMWLDKKVPSIDEVDELVEMWLTRFLNEPNEQTHYAFKPELIRKRDRAKEAIVAVPTKAQKQLELEKASRYVIQQSAWYIDFASQDAEYQAMKDAGVQKVKWNIYGDDKVCRKCSDLDGEIFLIDKVPPRPHLNCRCWLSLV